MITTRRLSCEKGQTSIEYVLMLVVVMTMIISVMGRVRERLIGTEFPCPADDKTLGCVVSRSVSSFGSTPDFRFFRLKR
jgi:Flp pilus assembly pilin Flp